MAKAVRNVALVLVLCIAFTQLTEGYFVDTLKAALSSIPDAVRDFVETKPEFRRFLYNTQDNPGWTDWSSWDCTYTTGCFVARVRVCPSGSSCEGQPLEKESCYNHNDICINSNNNQPVNHQNNEAHWLHWGSWRCNNQAGSCIMSRFRNCSTGYDANCNGDSYNVLPCDNAKCAVDGNWGHWGHWSKCSVTCGSGVITRTRHCSNPAPKNGGNQCPGQHSLTQKCDRPTCQVDGIWGNWLHWSACSATCGSGHKTRARHCDNPAPRHGGHYCVGSGSHRVNCQEKECPIDGGWGHWLPWAVCTASCGTGIQMRIRACNNPQPQHGGHNCSGNADDHQTCHKDCPINGGWGSWLPWTTCSQTCDSGSQRRVRPCNHPKPANGGHDCPGSAVESQTCNTQLCGTWSPWFYSTCTATCGTGSRTGMRRCSTGNEQDCSGLGITREKCNETPCPVDGHWGPWHSWSTCSRTCGTGGHQTRHRSCNNPAPAHHGKDCVGSGTKYQSCHEMDCPTWSAWFYGSCSVTCGTGTRQAMRRCSSGHESQCAGSAFKTESCHQKSC